MNHIPLPLPLPLTLSVCMKTNGGMAVNHFALLTPLRSVQFSGVRGCRTKDLGPYEPPFCSEMPFFDARSTKDPGCATSHSCPALREPRHAAMVTGDPFIAGSAAVRHRDPVLTLALSTTCGYEWWARCVQCSVHTQAELRQ